MRETLSNIHIDVDQNMSSTAGQETSCELESDAHSCSPHRLALMSPKHEHAHSFRYTTTPSYVMSKGRVKWPKSSEDLFGRLVRMMCSDIDDIDTLKGITARAWQERTQNMKTRTRSHVSKKVDSVASKFQVGDWVDLEVETAAVFSTDQNGAFPYLSEWLPHIQARPTASISARGRRLCNDHVGCNTRPGFP